ncbi:BEL1-like homeodomain protein [Sarracenia purpurea var. burkii]
MDPPTENPGGNGIVDEPVSGLDSDEQLRKKSRLMSMLDEDEVQEITKSILMGNGEGSEYMSKDPLVPQSF